MLSAINVAKDANGAETPSAFFWIALGLAGLITQMTHSDHD